MIKFVGKRYFWFLGAEAQRVARLNDGRNINQMNNKSMKWFSLASAQGDEDVKKAKSYLAQKMTPEQIAKGFRLARDFKPSSAPESGAPAPPR